MKLDHLACLHRRDGIHQARRDMATVAPQRPIEQRGGYCLVRIEPGNNIDHQHANTLRHAGRIFVDRHQSRVGLQNGIRRRPFGAWPLTTEASDRDIDDVRIAHLDRVVVQTKLLHDAGAIVLDNDICFMHQRLHRRKAIFRFEIHRKAALASIKRDVVGAEVAKLAPNRPPPVTFQRFHLDDIGTVLRHQHAAMRTGDSLRQVNNPDACQRLVWGSTQLEDSGARRSSIKRAKKLEPSGIASSLKS